MANVDVGKATNAQLATGLAQMLSGGMMVYPNPVETEIEKRGHEFIEDSNNLFVLASAAGRTPANFENSILKKLKHAKSITKIYLYPVPGWDEKDPVFDFTNFTKLVGKYLPEVTELTVQHMLVKNFELKNWLQIRKLVLIDPQCQDSKWSLELENLEELIMENHTPPVKLFASSLVQCPKIQRFFAHKYWAEEHLPSFYLPNCTDFTFRRGDCCEKLILYLPRVKMMNLDANYDLKVLKFLKQGHAAQAQWNLPTQAQHSTFVFSCQNAILGPKVYQELESSGRVLNGIDTEDDDLMMSDDHELEESEESEKDIEQDAEDRKNWLGCRVRVMHLKSRKDLIGKEGKVTEVFPEKDRVGVWFFHENLELSLPRNSVALIRHKQKGQPRKVLPEHD